MGRIKTKLVKRVTKELMKKYSDKVNENYEDNKKAVAGLINSKSKKMKNIIAGYATRLKKAEEEI